MQIRRKGMVSLTPFRIAFVESWHYAPCSVAKFARNIGRGGLFFRPLGFLLLAAQAVFPQAPQVTPGGVVNAASYAQPISPGSAVSIFGTNLASAEATASGSSLPTELGGTSVSINGVKAPLFYVSPRQINLQFPSSLDYSNYTLTQVTVVVTTAAGASDPVHVPLYAGSPAAFTIGSTGCGRAAALNVARGGSVSLNSPSNSAAPGDYVSLFATGLGLPGISIPDGTFSTGPDRLQIEPGVWIDGNPLPTLQYAGLAPMLVGVDQINFQIPNGTREGCSIPVAVGTEALISPTVSISIHSGRGQCVDPADQSYGQLVLTKTIATGTANDGDTETLTAAFPSGPGVQSPPSQVVVGSNATDPTPVSRSCPLDGFTELSAGTIKLSPPGTDAAISAQPVQDVNGVRYQQALPAGFIAPGQYNISASGGKVAFQGQLSVPPPIQIQTALPPGTVISTSHPFTINWTGGSPGTLVKVMLISELGIWNPYDYGYVNSDSGTFTDQPVCTTGGDNLDLVVCSFGMPTSTNPGAAQVVVEFSPAPEATTSFSAQGLTGSVNVSWKYRYVFGGLTFE